MNNLGILLTLIFTLTFPTFGAGGNASLATIPQNCNSTLHHSCYICGGCGCYYYWDDCYWTEGASSGVTYVGDIPCANNYGWDMGQGWSQTLSRTFTADNSHPSWELDFQVYFEDPHHDWFNQLNAIVYVTHANGATSIYHLWSHVGSDPAGSLYCVRAYGTFYAVSGDVITIEFKSSKMNEDTHIRVNNIIVWGNPF